MKRSLDSEAFLQAVLFSSWCSVAPNCETHLWAGTFDYTSTHYHHIKLVKGYTAVQHREPCFTNIV